MELKTKYQYTYFIYPYIIEKKDYTNYLYSLLKNKKCKLKIFNSKKDIGIDSYFLPRIKNKLFWTLNLGQKGIKSYEKMDTRMKANILSSKYCAFFEYNLQEDIPAKIGEENGIFFDISKVEIVCFSTGICFLLMKTILNSSENFSDILNFNYKFKDIHSKREHQKEYDNIKIQTQKLNNMKNFEEFLKEIVGNNLISAKADIDTESLITYSYVCLEQNSWNENTDLIALEKEFEKYYHILPEVEQIDDITSEEKLIYKEKYLYYGFSSNSNVLMTSEANIKNYTNLLFKYENEWLYHFLYDLHQKIYLKRLNFKISNTKKILKEHEEFLNFVKTNWAYEVTNNEKGIILEKYNKKAQNIDEIFKELKDKYDLLYEEYKIKKVNKHNKYIIAVIVIMLILNIINMCIIFKNL